MNSLDQPTIEQGIATTLWVKGVSHPVTVLWVTESHAEIFVPDVLNLDCGQLTAVILREFISMPMRVIAQTGQSVVLHFVQKPHASVLELIDRDLIKAGIAQLRDGMEERAAPTNARADIEAWQSDAKREEQEIVATFEERVRSLDQNRNRNRPEKLIAA